MRPPAGVRAATDELLAELDTAGQFVMDRITTGTDEDFTPREEVEAAIRSWLPGLMGTNEWRVEQIVAALKTRFRYDRKRLGTGASKKRARPWGFYGRRLEASGS